ncbi:O-methyltransferase MdmC-like [Panicum virgatum]|uniref:O-methyltransferase MdmC-like n=1 Tax=Panicum virgatum TaxID=38727 RepID=UPI0019D63454|nr:O-methyltransferase MdmC-like [Panicum virgatum]
MPPSPPPSQSGKRAKVTVARPEEPGTVGVKAAEPAAVDLLDSSLDNLRREEGGKRIGQQGPFLQKRGRSGRHGLFQPVGARRLGGRLISQSAEVLQELREETAAMRGSQMQVSPAQAQLLAMLVQIQGAQRCIEVGVFTGYSSLAVALALPESGRLVACERDERCLEIAKKYDQRAGVAHKIDVKHALAADSLRSLLDCGEASSYDFAFVDADKRMYEEYIELLLKLVRLGGLIVMDNVLWYGRVADPLIDDQKTISIRNFNKKVLEDMRVDISMVPLGMG